MTDMGALVANLIDQLHTSLDCADELYDRFGEDVAAKHYERADFLFSELQNLGVDDRLIFAEFETIH